MEYFRFFRTIFISAFLLPAFLTTHAQTNHNNPESPNTIEPLSPKTDEGFSFRLNTSSPTLARTGEVSLDGFDQFTQEAGSPRLPYYGTLIALPPKGEIIVSVTERNVVSQTIAQDISPAPSPVGPIADLDGTFLDYGPDIEIVGQTALRYEKSPDVYQHNAFYPEANYEISETIYYRDVRLVRLNLYPLQYNPVTQELKQAQNLDVRVTFSGVGLSAARPINAESQVIDDALASAVMNFEQAQQWRGLPANFQGSPTVLPIGIDTYKIEVNEDGIYEITHNQLANAGMNVANVNPNTFQLVYRGDSVAYEFDEGTNNNSSFDADDVIRFYGWAFDGPRTEAQYITNNIYWLWAGGTSDLIEDTNNPTQHPTASSYQATVTQEPENVWHSTWSNNWNVFPNEPDAWYWERIGNGQAKNYEVTLPNPVENGPDAVFTAEIMSRNPYENPSQVHEVTVQMNGHANTATDRWFDRANKNLSNSIPLSDINDGINDLTITVTETNFVYLNRLTVEYTRQFVALNNQLIFDSQSTNQSFRIGNYTNSNVDEVRVWNITDSKQPLNIPITEVNVGNEGENVNYFFGSDNEGKFLATHLDNVKMPVAITQYTPANLTPPNNQVDWLAISHRNFLDQANELATHRSNPLYGGWRTHVIDVEDVINQYGYGFGIPQAFQDFLAYTLMHWDVPPRYILLMGDASANPKQLACTASGCPGMVGARSSHLCANWTRFRRSISRSHSFRQRISNCSR